MQNIGKPSLYKKLISEMIRFHVQKKCIMYSEVLYHMIIIITYKKNQLRIKKFCIQNKEKNRITISQIHELHILYTFYQYILYVICIRNLYINYTLTLI